MAAQTTAGTTPSTRTATGAELAILQSSLVTKTVGGTSRAASFVASPEGKNAILGTMSVVKTGAELLAKRNQLSTEIPAEYRMPMKSVMRTATNQLPLGTDDQGWQTRRLKETASTISTASALVKGGYAGVTAGKHMVDGNYTAALRDVAPVVTGGKAAMTVVDSAYSAGKDFGEGRYLSGAANLSKTVGLTAAGMYGYATGGLKGADEDVAAMKNVADLNTRALIAMVPGGSGTLSVTDSLYRAKTEAAGGNYLMAASEATAAIGKASAGGIGYLLGGAAGIDTAVSWADSSRSMLQAGADRVLVPAFQRYFFSE